MRTLLLLAALLLTAACGSTAPSGGGGQTPTRAAQGPTAKPTARPSRPTATPRPSRPTAKPTAEPERPTATPRPSRPTATPRSVPASGLRTVTPDKLPPEARQTLKLIDQGGPFPYRRDGIVFQNRERRLPKKPSGYYHEYTVETPGSDDRGARRIITGESGERYYTDDHYETFVQVIE
jgi:ribonuclease T1